MASVHQRREQLGAAFDKLIDHTYDLGENKFDPSTPATAIASNMEKDKTMLTTKTEHTLMAYEDQMSLQVTDPARTTSREQTALSSTPSASTPIPLFRPQSDLKPAMLEKESR